MILHKFPCVLAVTAMACGGALAQSNRADTAARTAATLSRAQAAQTTATTTDISTYHAEAESDLGEQWAVSAKSGGLGAYLIGDTGLVYTSNPTLSSGGGTGDMYYYARGGAGIHPNLIGGLYLDGHVQQEIFQYATFSSLNFLRFNAGGGLDYVFEELGQLTVWVRYEYDRYLDGDSLDEFFVNNSLVSGVGKEFLINDTMALQTGAQAGISLTAEPSIARRNSYDFWLGWRWRILEPLELQTYYVLSLFYYPNDGSRVDVTQNVGGSLNYYFNRWARLTASASFGANNSTDSYFNYTVVNAGGSLGLDFRF